MSLEDGDMLGHGITQMCKNIERYRYVITWKDVQGYGRIQMSEDMGGVRFVKTSENADV